VRLRSGGDGATSGWLEREEASSTPVGYHVGILEASEAEYEGKETVNNESAHVLSVGTDTEEFRGFVLGTVETPLTSAGVVTETLLNDAEVRNASLRYLVSDGTDRVLRVKSNATVSAAVPNAEEELRITVETETSFSSYGGEVDLEEPSGIEDAEEGGGFSGSASGSAGASAYASEGGVVDVMEVRHRDSGGNETSTATVTTNPVTADRVTAEAVESGDTATAESLNASRAELVLELNPDGDEVVVRVTRGNGTEVVYSQTVSPE
jgi:hypothetical protein